jgi:hypothetical protein
MAIHFQQTTSFEFRRAQIEDYLFRSIMRIENEETIALQSVQAFNHSLEYLMETLEGMYQTLQPRDLIGEQSSVIHRGRYRVFYKVNARSTFEFDIIFLDIDDNRESNLDRFPSHRLMTFDDED